MVGSEDYASTLTSTMATVPQWSTSGQWSVTNSMLVTPYWIIILLAEFISNLSATWFFFPCSSILMLFVIYVFSSSSFHICHSYLAQCFIRCKWKCRNRQYLFGRFSYFALRAKKFLFSLSAFNFNGAN